MNIHTSQVTKLTPCNDSHICTVDHFRLVNLLAKNLSDTTATRTRNCLWMLKKILKEGSKSKNLQGHDTSDHPRSLWATLPGPTPTITFESFPPGHTWNPTRLGACCNGNAVLRYPLLMTYWSHNWASHWRHGYLGRVLYTSVALVIIFYACTAISTVPLFLL